MITIVSIRERKLRRGRLDIYGTCYYVLPVKSITENAQYNICAVYKSVTSIPINMTVRALRGKNFGLRSHFNFVREDDGKSP